VAKILVADDNSNIQKMVGLALKDQGIDVVAVGNGEAAVRKAMDIKPDLILADVFMPVRNGYEVCEYVKNEETLKHIPVILLVGAFDPLDEQEAQRVGADGVLKKPFVPPDPLISMVKAALTRAGVSIGGVPAPKPAPIPELRVSDLIAPRKEREPQLPVLATMPAILPPADQEFTAPVEEQSFVDELPAPPAPVTFEAGSSAVAFGNLLNTSSPAEDDAAFHASAQLAMDRDFKKKNQNEETGESEEDPTKPSWRRDDVDAQANPDFGTTGAVKDWRDTALADIPARPQAREAWENPEQKSTDAEAAQSGDAVVTAVKEFPSHETKEISQNMPFAGDSWAAAISAGAEEKGNETAREAAQDRTVEPAAAASETEKTSVANGWLATAPSPWDADAKKATDLATGWDHAVSEPAAPAGGSGETPHTETHAEALLPAATVEVIREEASQVAQDAEQAHHSEAAAVVPASAGAETKPAEPSMDELVARVLAKMTPEALQAVTREILKPVVEAIIREELSKK